MVNVSILFIRDWLLFKRVTVWPKQRLGSQTLGVKDTMQIVVVIYLSIVVSFAELNLHAPGHEDALEQLEIVRQQELLRIEARKNKAFRVEEPIKTDSYL